MGVTNDQIDQVVAQYGFDRSALAAARNNLGYVGSFEMAVALVLSSGDTAALSDVIAKMNDEATKQKAIVQHLPAVVHPPELPLHIPHPRAS